ncbi:hypothetical protein JMM81_11120 [Bacillus sp. V3B]|uniref:hypothetical protein n=1 Tax=Bacillus sp. V3B TaxID=2804915 RepID=UPI002108F66B|nr:hypothetical protein [Bacillus sp. V3B]MCQ6275508.1 hypothetical protein [Bacillus sp. V3B]
MLIERSRRGECYVLEIGGRNGSTLHGKEGSMALTIGQSDILKLFFEWEGALINQEILDNTTGIGNKDKKSVKTDISRLRTAIKKELDADGHNLIQTVGKKRGVKVAFNLRDIKDSIEKRELIKYFSEL